MENSLSVVHLIVIIIKFKQIKNILLIIHLYFFCNLLSVTFKNMNVLQL